MEYPDDFEASSSEDEAEYSDDFDEGEGHESIKEPMAAKTGGGLNKTGVTIESYSDEEFEQDSDSEVCMEFRDVCAPLESPYKVLR